MAILRFNLVARTITPSPMGPPVVRIGRPEHLDEAAHGTIVVPDESDTTVSMESNDEDAPEDDDEPAKAVT